MPQHDRPPPGSVEPGLGGLRYLEPDDHYVVDEVLNKQAYRHLNVVPGDRVLDLGAHVGSFVSYSLVRGAELVVAVEMNPEVLPYLEFNHGDDPRVIIVPRAVVSQSVAEHLQIRNYRNAMSASVMAVNTEDPHGLVVPTIPLPELLEAYQPTKLKFDIENSEYDAILNHAVAVTESPVTRMMGELHTKTEATYRAARQFHAAFENLGWTPSKPLDRFPKKPTGWNVIIYFTREES